MKKIYLIIFLFLISCSSRVKDGNKIIEDTDTIICEKGDPGEKGDKGDAGPPGQPGKNGEDGICIPCKDGEDGNNGDAGPKGDPGKDAICVPCKDGEDGHDGGIGPAGPGTREVFIGNCDSSGLLRHVLFDEDIEDLPMIQVFAYQDNALASYFGEGWYGGVPYLSQVDDMIIVKYNFEVNFADAEYKVVVVK